MKVNVSTMRQLVKSSGIGLDLLEWLLLQALVPVIKATLKQLLEAIEPDSDGGRKVTQAELKQIAEAAKTAFGDSLETLLTLIVGSGMFGLKLVK